MSKYDDWKLDNPYKDETHYCTECSREVPSEELYCSDCIDDMLNEFGIDFLVDKGIRFTDDEMVDILNYRIDEFIEWVRS